MSFLNPKEQLQKIVAGTVDVVSPDILHQKLIQSEQTKTALRIKAGFDPSRPDLHLGHFVLLNKLKVFQKLGHHILFVIGDFTAQIGDPSGCQKTRPILTETEVKENAKTYATQVFKVLDPKKTEICFNSKWMQAMSATKMIQLASQYTVARLLERDDFAKRWQQKNPISLHEFLYPLIQGYDSVVLKADVELGATDQLFNLLVGRDLQKRAGQDPQCAITVPLLEGINGPQKMSKSYHNTIALEDSPANMFGKIMKLSDDRMLHYYALLSDKTPKEIQQLKQEISSGSKHPKTAKMNLASLIVNQFYNEKESQKAAHEFERVFSAHEIPSDIPEYSYPATKNIWVCHLLREIKLVPSTSEAKRLIQSHAVLINGEKITDPNLKLQLKKANTFIIKAGKRRFAKVRIT